MKGFIANPLRHGRSHLKPFLIVASICTRTHTYIYTHKHCTYIGDIHARPEKHVHNTSKIYTSISKYFFFLSLVRETHIPYSVVTYCFCLSWNHSPFLLLSILPISHSSLSPLLRPFFAFSLFSFPLVTLAAFRRRIFLPYCLPFIGLCLSLLPLPLHFYFISFAGNQVFCVLCDAYLIEADRGEPF